MTADPGTIAAATRNGAADEMSPGISSSSSRSLLACSTVTLVGDPGTVTVTADDLENGISLNDSAGYVMVVDTVQGVTPGAGCEVDPNVDLPLAVLIRQQAQRHFEPVRGHGRSTARRRHARLHEQRDRLLVTRARGMLDVVRALGRRGAPCGQRSGGPRMSRDQLGLAQSAALVGVDFFLRLGPQRLGDLGRRELGVSRRVE